MNERESGPLWRVIIRLALVYVVATAVFGLVAGERLTKPSHNNHYVHLAKGWTEGRLHLEKDPPRYKKRAHDDWAKVVTLTLADGREVRGFPCLTGVCNDQKRKERIETWWLIDDRRWEEIPRGDIVKRKRTWYVSFPPGPAVLMLPFVAVGGLKFWDVLFTVLLAGFIPMLLVANLDELRGRDQGRGVEHLLAAAALAFASPLSFVAPHGSVWFTAQVVAVLGLVIYLGGAWETRRPMLAGLGLAMAMSARPHLLFAGLFFALEWWRGERDWRALMRFAIPVGVVGLALATHNYVRFSSPFEFGHRFLDIRWQTRMQEIGMFDPSYVPRNLRAMLAIPPRSNPEWPYLRVSIHGLALPLVAPWLVTVAAARQPLPQRLGLGLAALACALPSVFYQNTGQLQVSYRFALDWLPMLMFALVAGGGLADRGRRITFGVLLAPALVLNLTMAWAFGRTPAKLFVIDPLGWPFEDELRPPD